MNDTIEDAEGTRIGNFAIDWIPKPMVSMWDSENEKWIEQEIDPKIHVPMIIHAMTMVSVYSNPPEYIDEILGDESE